MNAVSNLTFIIVTVCGGYFAVEGIISVGVISAFLVYARLLGRPVNELAMVAGQLMSAVAAAERVFAMLDEAEEDMGGEDFRPGGGAGITFEGVSFGYVPGRDVLKDVSFSIPAGQKAALVGSSGSGKTTVANLLMRFYEPGRGRILVGGLLFVTSDAVLALNAFNGVEFALRHAVVMGTYLAAEWLIVSGIVRDATGACLPRRGRRTA